jgi:hypothetical protein
MSSTDYCVVGLARYQGWNGVFRLQTVATGNVDIYTGTTTPVDSAAVNVLVFE